jgi:hypothetical protein
LLTGVVQTVTVSRAEDPVADRVIAGIEAIEQAAGG